MPRACTVCIHPKRRAIEKALVAGLSIRDIAGQWKVSKSSVERHKEHIPAKLTKAKEAKEIAHADNLLDEVRNLQARALKILDVSESAGDLPTALKAIREARGCLELLGRLAGELKDGITINVLSSREWIEIRTVIIRTLEAYPDARAAVVGALRGAESRC